MQELTRSATARRRGPRSRVLGTPTSMDQVRALGKFIASFFKDRWSLQDYPIRFLERTPGPGGGRRKACTWTAQIVNWWHMRGDAFSRDDALARLGENFARFRAANNLPRPGRGAPLRIEFAATAIVDANAAMVSDILERVLGFRPGECLVTDESSLWDFHDGETNDDYVRRIALLYGVDVSDVDPPTEPAPIWWTG